MLKRCFHGFQIHGRLHQFGSLVLYSTSSVVKDVIPISNPLMVDFLAKSVGFSEDEAVSIVTNCKVSHRFKSSTKSQMIIDFLKSSGFEESHIRKLVTDNPMVLHHKVEKTLKPKIRAYQELGFCGSNLGLITSQYPYMLNGSLNKVVHTLVMLKSLVGSNEQLGSLLLKTNSQKLLSGGFLKYLPDNLLLLQSYGLQMEQIKRFIPYRFLVLSCSTESLKEILKVVEQDLGIPRTSGSFFYGIYVLSGKMRYRLDSWLGVFRSFGWSETEISMLLRKFPSSLSLSESAVRVKLKYFMEDLGLGSDYLVMHPALLSYSIEKRIVPRTVVMKDLKEKQVLKCGISLYNSMSMSESKFMEKYMIPVKDKLPELYEYYTQTKAVSLTKT